MLAAPLRPEVAALFPAEYGAMIPVGGTPPKKNVSVVEGTIPHDKWRLFKTPAQQAAASSTTTSTESQIPTDFETIFLAGNVNNAAFEAIEFRPQVQKTTLCFFSFQPLFSVVHFRSSNSLQFS
jgi:hypothetical protein